MVKGLQRQLIDRIGNAIATGDLTAGEQIVPEALAATHGVSRTVVREALKVLETKGLVSARPRTGTRISPLEDWHLLDSDVIRWRSAGPDSSRQIEELLTIRGAIEPLAAREASSRTIPAQLDRLDAALDAMSSAVDHQDWDRFTEADVTFHRHLLICSGNQIMMRFAEPIEAAIRVRARLHLIPDELTPRVVESHRAIREAIAEQDPATAERACRSIVDVAGLETMKSLAQDASNPTEQRSAP